MVLGWYLSNKEFKYLSNKFLVIFGILLFIFSTLTAFYFLNNGISFGIEYKLSIIPMLQATGIYLFIKNFACISVKNKKSLSNKLYLFIKDSKIGKIIESISFCSYGMYLTHYIFIWTVVYSNDITNILSKNPYKMIPIVYILTVLFSWTLIWIFSKLHYLKKVSGT